MRLGVVATLLLATVQGRCGDNNPPDLMTYQGFLADQNGTALGTMPLRNRNQVVCGT